MQDSPARELTEQLPLRFEAVGYRVGTTQILSGVDLEFSAGPPTLLLGPNGSGKTTLLRLAMGLLQPTQGRILSGGRPLEVPNRMAIVFQKPAMLRRSAIANVAFAMAAAGHPADRAATMRYLDEVGLAALADRPARRLSGGEQQRLSLARALSRSPQVLLLDEPTASLDPSQTKAVEDSIARASASGIKIVMASHDLGEARRLAGDVVFLVKGRICERAPADRFFASPATSEARRFLAGDLLI